LKNFKNLEDKEDEVIFLKEKVAKVEKEKEEAVKVHDADMTKMKEQNKSISELHTSIEAVRESITSKDRENQKILETLELLGDSSFTFASLCYNALKKIFSFVGATL
jgi:oligoribonuclease (3'-5' exoribonuclease)